ncbi:MAG: hypothetical protein HYU37_18215 [Acidobacteria bacterium]|nr:hypothetical protein [Acidobacteriota bacterium]
MARQIETETLRTWLDRQQPVTVLDIRTDEDRVRTPGHTDESTSYVLNDAAVFTGDTLFTNGVGRPDLHANADTARQRARAL